MAVSMNFYDQAQAPYQQKKPPMPPTGGVTGAGGYGTPITGSPLAASPAQPKPVTGPPLQAAPSPPAQQPQPTTPDPFAASGGGVFINGGWIPKNNPAAIAAAGGAGGPSGAGQPGSQPAANPLGDAFRNALMARLQTNPTPTSIADDPTLLAQSGAMRQASARQAARDRSQAVEGATASGLGVRSGGTQADLRKLESERAFNEGQFDANLLGGAREQRMQELQAFLTIAGNTLSDQERNAIERELGLLDASIRQEGIRSQTDLGRGDLDLRKFLGKGQLDQNLLSILLNNRTDNDRLGLQAGEIGLNANMQALLAMVRGGGN